MPFRVRDSNPDKPFEINNFTVEETAKKRLKPKYFIIGLSLLLILFIYVGYMVSVKLNDTSTLEEVHPELQRVSVTLFDFGIDIDLKQLS